MIFARNHSFGKLKLSPSERTGGQGRVQVMALATYAVLDLSFHRVIDLSNLWLTEAFGIRQPNDQDLSGSSS